jgi:predicted phage terminase large subunit-like protein
VTVPVAVRALAELELRRRRRARTVTLPAFRDWLPTAFPDFRFDAPHFGAMIAVLDRVTVGELHRCYFQIPIRHAKSTVNTIGYAVYRLLRDPRTRIIVGSYNQRQAEKFSREIRKLARAHGVAVSGDRDAAGEWDTEAGGGLRATGAGAGVAGANADLILIDDPIGSRDEAESAAHRDRVYDWLTNDLLARAEPHTAVAMTMSRWHQDDPAGRIREGRAGPWHVVDLPAEAEANDPLGRALGAPLWPEMRGAEWLAQKKAEMGAYGFAALLQGRPRPREGGMFKWDWWHVLGTVPALPTMVRYWDLAGTEPKGGGHDPDYSVGTLGGRMTDGRTAILHQAAFRHSIGQRDAELERIARADAATYGMGRVAWWIEAEAGIAGDERTAALVRRLQGCGISVRTERPTGSKVIRAEPLAAAAEAGNLCLAPDDLSAPWHDAFRQEAADFPNGRHDDRVDATVGMFNKLAVRHTALVHSHAL